MNHKFPNPSNIQDTINWLLEYYSITDFEAAAQKVIEKFCEVKDVPFRYIGSNLFIGSDEAKIMLMTHIDRVGFVATGGVVKTGSIITVQYISETKKKFSEIVGRFENCQLVGYDPISGNELFYARLFTDEISFYLEINNAVSEFTIIEPIPVSPIKTKLKIDNGIAMGVLDNTCGVAIGIKNVFSRPNQISCLISTKEEGGGYKGFQNGGRGAIEFIGSYNPKALIVVVDVRPTISSSQEIVVGNGPVLRLEESRKKENGIREKLLLADEQALKILRGFALENSIKIQEYRGSGITEIGRAKESMREVAIRCCWIQPPVLNNHTINEVVSLQDLYSTNLLVEGLLEGWLRNE